MERQKEEQKIFSINIRWLWEVELFSVKNRFSFSGSTGEILDVRYCYVSILILRNATSRWSMEWVHQCMYLAFNSLRVERSDWTKWLRKIWDPNWIVATLISPIYPLEEKRKHKNNRNSTFICCLFVYTEHHPLSNYDELDKHNIKNCIQETNHQKSIMSTEWM